jgi:hypothetical protein
MANVTVGPPPSIAVKLAIDPPSFKMSDRVRLSVTAISNASTPITIYTWPNVFNPELAQMGSGLVAFDKETHKVLRLHDMDVKLGPINFTLGGTEDKFFVTLEPGKPSVSTTGFAYGFGTLPGHKYLLDLKKAENVGWWKRGRKADVPNLPGKDRGAQHSDGEPILLSLDKPVEFKFLPLDD